MSSAGDTGVDIEVDVEDDDTATYGPAQYPIVIAITSASNLYYSLLYLCVCFLNEIKDLARPTYKILTNLFWTLPLVVVMKPSMKIMGSQILVPLLQQCNV